MNRLRRDARPAGLLAEYCETLGMMRLRAQKELALRTAKMEAERSSRMKAAFLANMSHELRTPLNAIIGFSDLIMHLGGDATKNNVEYATHIGDAGRHLLDVISDILDISKIESGTETLQLAEHDLRNIIESTLILICDRIEKKEQKLEIRLPADLPMLTVDERRIKQLLLNLLSNAHKFTPERGSIVIGAERARSGITITVSDTGCGMSASEQLIALKPFGQIRSGHMHSHMGTGLGLPIAVALARLHGGDLVLTSKCGEGTKATVILPDISDALHAPAQYSATGTVAGVDNVQAAIIKKRRVVS